MVKYNLFVLLNYQMLIFKNRESLQARLDFSNIYKLMLPHFPMNNLNLECHTSTDMI